jgi:hypothetical protein
MSVSDAEHSGCAATSTQNENRARELILQNRRMMVNKTAKQSSISIGSACSVVHDNLLFLQVCVRGVPKELTDEYKHMHLNIRSLHLACCHKESDNFLQWIGDES